MPPISSCPNDQFTRAPPSARGATAGSRSLLTRLSSAKTSVILYDKKMGAAHRVTAPLPPRDKSIARRERTRTPRPHARASVRPPTGRTSDRVKSKQRSKNDGKRHSRVSSRSEPLLPSPCEAPAITVSGQNGRERRVGVHHFARASPSQEASAIDCFLHHKAMVKSKHVKANHDATRSLGGGLLPCLCDCDCAAK